MNRRDRDHKPGAPAPRRNDRGPQGARAPNDRGPQGARAQQGGHGGPRRPQGPQAAPKLPSYEDPNAYRSPGFQDAPFNNPYKIDYAGLPKDDEDPEGTLLTPQGRRNDGAPRGLNGRRPDRTGTDPNAYRSPGFHGDHHGRSRGPSPARLPQRDVADTDETLDDGQKALERVTAAPTGPSRRDRRAQRPRFETNCSACGAAAVVPFEPSAERPAFCKPCYETRREGLGLGPGRRTDGTSET